MKKTLLAILLGFCPALLFGGQPNQNKMEEIQETLRFLRLAESRKALEMDENALLKLNEVADRYEAEKMQLKRREMILERQAEQDTVDAESWLREYQAVKEAMAANEKTFITSVRASANAEQAKSFIVFYEKFQRQVQRRVRTLQNQNGPQSNRFPNRRRQ